MKNQLSVRRIARLVFLALGSYSSAATVFAADPVDLGTVGATAGATNAVPTAAKSAPSQGSLTARSAQSEVSDSFIRDFTSPVSDYSQVLQMTPGVFSYSPNGVGLGDTKSTMRGSSDSNNVITFDGIPFNDTNGVSHHSWVFFPSQFIGGAVVDRSPGSAATIGQATFAGSISLLSRNLEAQRRTSVEGSYGDWNTRLIGIEHETGQFGAEGASNLLFNIHEMESDGYQSYNHQKRDATSLKYQYALSADTAVTAFASFLNLKTNTPSIKGVTRANINAGNYTQLLGGDPSKADYYGYNFYNILTDFNYVGVSSNLGNGWKLEDKVYIYRYWNKQNYNNFAYKADGITPDPATLTTSSAVDKLNSYVTKGNLLRLSNESSLGIFRVGLWYDVADSWRYQIPSDPKTWIDQAAPNFNEKYRTTTAQPYVEFEFKLSPELRITPGVKYASYKQDYTHQQDNGGAVGPLGGVLNKATGIISGGAASVANSVSYSDVLPSIDLHYALRPNWSAYAQYVVGDQIPDTGVFDVTNAKVAAPPKPTKSKTFQIGTVWKSDQYTLDVNAYSTKLDNAYTKTLDPATSLYNYPLVGQQTSEGIEAESNIVLGSGFSLYLNATSGSTRYDSGKWVAGAPSDTETLGLNYQQGGWNTGLFAKRVGKMYNDGTDAAKNTVNQAFTIDPVTVANLFINYTLRNPASLAKQAKIQLGINNLFNNHNTVAVAGQKSSSSAAPNVADLLTVLPERSASLTLTLDF